MSEKPEIVGALPTAYCRSCPGEQHSIIVERPEGWVHLNAPRIPHEPMPIPGSTNEPPPVPGKPLSPYRAAQARARRSG